ncbi:MAG: gamma-glutamyltransferase family protein [Caldilineaceae bacterium]
MRGIVVCVDPRAAETGVEVLEDGGNAFDAALATAFAQTVVLPFSCGVGGFLSAQLWAPQQSEHLVIDGCLRAGARVTADMWADAVQGEAAFSGASLFADMRSDIGYTSICTPGTVAALAQLHERFCTMPWAELLAPAIALARQGFPVTPEMHMAMTRPVRAPYQPDALTRLRATAACAQIYLTPNGAFRNEGDTIRNPEYANTLERLAQAGPSDFYQGELATAISQDLEANGAFVTQADLATYRANRYAPISTTYHDHEVFTNNAPGGGPLLVEALNILEGFDMGRLVHSGVEHLHYLGATLQIVNHDRREYLGDPEVIGAGPGEVLRSKARAAQLRQAIFNGVVDRIVPPSEEPETTHLTVVDDAGNIASITHSLGAFSGVVTPGLGFIYNNGMNRFDPRPGRASSLAPGKARLHLMMPTIVCRAGQPVMALGAPGGNAILSACTQVLVNVVDFGMSAVEAVSAPRIHAEGSTLWGEARLRQRVAAGLQERGHTVIREAASLSQRMARVQLVCIGPDSALTGGSDPRAGSAVMVATETSAV